MDKFTIFCIFSISLVVLGTWNVEAQEKTCKGILAEQTKKQMAAIGTCGKEMGFKTGREKALKMNCIIKCAMISTGVFGKNGLVDKEASEAYFQATFPENLRDQIRPHFEKCSPQVAALDPKDEMCKTYEPFIKCLTEVSTKMCN